MLPFLVLIASTLALRAFGAAGVAVLDSWTVCSGAGTLECNCKSRPSSQENAPPLAMTVKTHVCLSSFCSIFRTSCSSASPHRSCYALVFKTLLRSCYIIETSCLFSEYCLPTLLHFAASFRQHADMEVFLCPSIARSSPPCSCFNRRSSKR